MCNDGIQPASHVLEVAYSQGVLTIEVASFDDLCSSLRMFVFGLRS